jgi:hypothetical protein
VLLALRGSSTGRIYDRDRQENEEDYVDGLPLSETDGWKDLTADTDLKTTVGKLEGITIDGSGLVTEIKTSAKMGMQGDVLRILTTFEDRSKFTYLLCKVKFLILAPSPLSRNSIWGCAGCMMSFPKMITFGDLLVGLYELLTVFSCHQIPN